MYGPRKRRSKCSALETDHLFQILGIFGTIILICGQRSTNLVQSASETAANFIHEQKLQDKKCAT